MHEVLNVMQHEFHSQHEDPNNIQGILWGFCRRLSSPTYRHYILKLSHCQVRMTHILVYSLSSTVEMRTYNHFCFVETKSVPIFQKFTFMQFRDSCSASGGFRFMGLSMDSGFILGYVEDHFRLLRSADGVVRCYRFTRHCLPFNSFPWNGISHVGSASHSAPYTVLARSSSSKFWVLLLAVRLLAHNGIQSSRILRTKRSKNPSLLRVAANSYIRLMQFPSRTNSKISRCPGLLPQDPCFVRDCGRKRQRVQHHLSR